jgi:hypothetical protein
MMRPLAECFGYLLSVRLLGLGKAALLLYAAQGL